MSDIDAHHVLRRSQGENDYLTVPLRHDIHMRGHTEGFDQVEGEFAIDIKDAMIACLVERMQELEEELKRCKRKR